MGALWKSLVILCVPILCGLLFCASMLMAAPFELPPQDGKADAPQWSISLLSALKDTLPLGDTLELTFGIVDGQGRTLTPRGAQARLYGVQPGRAAPFFIAATEVKGGWASFQFVGSVQSRVQLYVEFGGARSALSESLRIGPPLPDGFLTGLQTGGEMPLFTWAQADAYCQSHGGLLPEDAVLRHIAGVAGGVDAQSGTNAFGWPVGTYWTRDQAGQGQYRVISLKRGESLTAKATELHRSVCVAP